MNQSVRLPKTRGKVDFAKPAVFRSTKTKKGAPKMDMESPVNDKAVSEESKDARSISEPAHAPATQKDLVELHKRIVALFTTLTHGLTEAANARAEGTHIVVDERLDRLEKSICDLEGALRIELPPRLEQALQSNSANIKPSLRMSGVCAFVWTCVLIAALFLGAVYSTEVLYVSDILSDEFNWAWSKLSPFGGSSVANP